MGFKNLAEAVILQSLADLWDPTYREESRVFFQGEAFEIYAALADLAALNIDVKGGRENGRAIGVH